MLLEVNISLLSQWIIRLYYEADGLHVECSKEVKSSMVHGVIVEDDFNSKYRYAGQTPYALSHILQTVFKKVGIFEIYPCLHLEVHNHLIAQLKQNNKEAVPGDSSTPSLVDRSFISCFPYLFKQAYDFQD